MDGDVLGTHAVFLEDVLVAETDLVVIVVGVVAFGLGLVGGGEDCDSGAFCCVPIGATIAGGRLSIGNGCCKIIKDR